MTTDVLSPRILGPFLELYDFEFSSYLSMYLSCYDLFQNHITGVDREIVEKCLLDEEAMREFDFTAVLCIATSRGAEAIVLSNDPLGELLLIKPGDDGPEGCAAFGTESILEHFQDFLGVEMSQNSQRPLQ